MLINNFGMYHLKLVKFFEQKAVFVNWKHLGCDMSSFRNDFTSVPKENMNWDEVIGS